MTPAAKARANALHCEAKKHAYRQTQDGVVISFVLHPQDMPEGLAAAPLGTRYVLALVELNSDETPKEQPSPVQSKPVEKEHHDWHSMSPAQQAGILCNDPNFHRFLAEKVAPEAMAEAGNDVIAAAASIVRERCLVASRKDIRENHISGRLWRDLVSDYRAWSIAPEMVPI